MKRRQRIVTAEVPYDESVSSRTRWERRQIAEGRCGRCGQPRNLYRHYCDSCAVKNNERQRHRAGAVRRAPTYLSGRKKSTIKEGA